MTNSACRRRRNGNMPVARGRRPASTRGIRTGTWIMRDGIEIMVAARHMSWDRRKRTRGVCTICMGTCGNGARIGLGDMISGGQRTQPVPRRGRAMFCAGDPGPESPQFAVRRSVVNSVRCFRTTTLAFALLGCADPEEGGTSPLPSRRQDQGRQTLGFDEAMAGQGLIHVFPLTLEPLNCEPCPPSCCSHGTAPASLLCQGRMPETARQK